jgi:plasmid stability protein
MGNEMNIRIMLFIACFILMKSARADYWWNYVQNLSLQSASKFRLQCNHSLGILLSMITKGVPIMATNLVVRNVEEDVALALKQLAASHGRSAEAEHREILKSVLQRPRRRSVAEVLLSMPNVGEDADFNFRNT